MAIRGPGRGPTYKVVLLGELGVGKTSLFRRVKDNTFDEYQTATTGIDSCTKVVKIDGQNVMVRGMLLEIAYETRESTNRMSMSGMKLCLKKSVKGGARSRVFSHSVPT